MFIFYRNLGGPCKAIAPEVDKLNTAYNDNVLFIKVDVDDYEDLSEEWS